MLKSKLFKRPMRIMCIGTCLLSSFTVASAYSDTAKAATVKTSWSFKPSGIGVSCKAVSAGTTNSNRLSHKIDTIGDSDENRNKAIKKRYSFSESNYISIKGSKYGF